MSQLSFGGMHTEEKLRVLEGYLSAYQKVLKNKAFTTVFFDAFAGTGEIPTEEVGGLFEDVEEAEPFIEGSARRALCVDPPFTTYIFVEKSRRKVASLTALKTEFPNLSSRIQVMQADANESVKQFCSDTDWRRTRAVMFLDPFGNQVGWNSLEAIARTKAIDLWYLFPAGLGVNRQISGTGEFDANKASSLDFMLGTTEWRKEFIGTEIIQNLWGEHQESSVKQANVDSVTRFMIKRMKQIFGGVVLDEWASRSRWRPLVFAPIRMLKSEPESGGNC